MKIIVDVWPSRKTAASEWSRLFTRIVSIALKQERQIKETKCKTKILTIILRLLNYNSERRAKIAIKQYWSKGLFKR